jgi:T5SS/PEP-CTERM-associated repeat protein
MERMGFVIRWFLAAALCILTSALLSGIAQAQTNTWTNPSRGFWDDSESWSLGVLPNNSQSVFVTNALSKTVTIDSYTAGTYPGSLTISNLTVSTPDGATNTLFLDNAGVTPPLSVLDTLDIDTNGALVVNGSVVQVSGNLFVGQLGDNDTLTITNGAQVYSGSGYVGYGDGGDGESADNVVTVVGSGSVWSNSGDLFVGDYAESYTYNSLIILDGGVVQNAEANVAGTSSSVLVMGYDSVWNNDGDLVLGGGSGDVSIIIANGGMVYDNNSIIGNVGGNSVLVTGSGSVWSNREDLSIESLFGGDNSLTISNGGTVYSTSSELGGDDNDFVLVTGTDSVWKVTGSVFIGGVGSSFVISDGGAVYSGSGEIAQPSQVSGSGSVWHINSSLNIPYSVTFTIFHEGLVIANSVSISGGAIVNVTDGGLYADTISIGPVVGTLNLNGGTVTANQLFVVSNTTDVSSSFALASGLLTSGGTSVSNGQNFVVGDGTDGATFQLASGGTGIHSFANGLTISSNAFLTGCGTVEGSVVDNPGGTIVANCGDTLTFTGIVTNNGTMQALNGSVLEAYGLVVNNGVIDIRAGATNFHGGFINNGIVITTNNVPVVTAIQVVGPDIEIGVQTGNGSTYIFEETTNLTGGTWTPIIEFYGTGGIINFIDPGAATLPQRFYRVGLVPPP